MDINAAARISALGNAMPQAGGRTAVMDDSFFCKVMEAAAPALTEAASETRAISLEEMLKARYPGLVYHVFDGSSRYWQTRSDYPFHLLYQENIDTEAIENWRPSGPNPDQVSAVVQHNMSMVPPGGKAVVIHPRVQARMEQDPEYAKEILRRIEAWFAFDVARNEAILPGSTAGMSQSLAIGEDGGIVNVQASSPPELNRSKREDSDDRPDFWDLRAKRHAWYMRLRQEEQLAHSLEVTNQLAAIQSAQTVKTHLLEMLNSDELRKALGDTILGMPVEDMLEQTRREVFGTSCVKPFGLL